MCKIFKNYSIVQMLQYNIRIFIAIIIFNFVKNILRT